jgi:hypothetical protein
MKKVSETNSRKTPNTHFILSSFVFLFENRAVYEIMWNNVAETGRPLMTTWRISIACSVPKATNKRTVYVILIAFPLQQWLHERDSMLRYTTLPVLSLIKKKCFLFKHNDWRIVHLYCCVLTAYTVAKYYFQQKSMESNRTRRYTFKNLNKKTIFDGSVTHLEKRMERYQRLTFFETLRETGREEDQETDGEDR